MIDSLDDISPRRIERVGFGPRLAAMFIDSVFLILIVLGICNLVISFGLSDFFSNKTLGMLKLDEDVYEEMEKNLGTFFNTYLVMIALSNSVGLLYSLIEAMFGASPGKMILGLQIANEDGSVGDMNLFMKRWFAKNLSGILGLLYVTFGISMLNTVGGFVSILFLIGCFFVLNEKRQGLHDIITHAAVFKKADLKEHF
jgi:uncharacterized RDD family membrane protein YckC